MGSKRNRTFVLIAYEAGRWEEWRDDIFMLCTIFVDYRSIDILIMSLFLSKGYWEEGVDHRTHGF